MIPPYFAIGWNATNVLEELEKYKNSSEQPNKGILQQGLILIANCQMATNPKQTILPNIQTIRTYMKFSHYVKDSRWLNEVQSTMEKLLQETQPSHYELRSLDNFLTRLHEECVGLSWVFNSENQI